MPRLKSDTLELSGRELAVAKLIAEDMKPSEIAKKLKISVKTVSTYRARVIEKLRRTGVRGDVGIALYVLKMKPKKEEPPQADKAEIKETLLEGVPTETKETQSV